MPERIYPGSPSQEFYDLSKLYVRRFGKMGEDTDTWGAQLGRLRFSCMGSNLLVEYLRPCAAHFEMVWSNHTGFNVPDWHDHLETLRKILILERLAIIDE